MVDGKKMQEFGREAGLKKFLYAERDFGGQLR